MNENDFFSGSKLFQFLAAGAGYVGAFSLGTGLGWSSPALPSLKDDPDFAYLNDDKLKSSFLGSFVPIGALCACLITGFMIEKVGRKTAMLITAPPFVGGWLLMAFAQNYGMILAGRFITGFCGGSFSLSAPVYVGETAEPKLRGMLGSGYQLIVVTGILFSYAVGSYVKWNILSLICAFVPAIFAVCMFFMPESPRYYIMKNNVRAASNSLMKLRGATSASQIAQELAAIEASVEEASRNRVNFKDLLHPAILKPTLISFALMVFQQLGGINAVIFNMQTIFQDAGSTLAENEATIIVGGVLVGATAICTLLIDRTGRKILLIISDAGMGLSLVVLGVYFYLQENNNPVYEDIGWLPLVSLMIFIIAFSLGYGPIPWLMVGEILPKRALGLASSLATALNWFLAVLVTQFFESLKDAIKNSSAFWLFAAISGIGTVFAIFVLPETKGKTLDEIQAIFGGTDVNRNKSTHDNESYSKSKEEEL